MNDIFKFDFNSLSVLAAMDTQWWFFGWGMLSLVALVWIARPKNTRARAGAGMAAVVALGVGIALWDPSEVVSQWLKYTGVLCTPPVVWCLVREGWKGYTAPWLFSWRRVGAILLGLVVLGYLMFQAVLPNQKDAYWALYTFTLMMAPLYGFHAFMWWFLHALKRVYIGKYLREETVERVVDTYFLLWWNHKVRQRPISKQAWLETTLAWPQFMQSPWWQGVGKTFWPDVLDWHVSMGTSNMVWFLQERDKHPPEQLEDVSDAGAVWA